MTETLKPLIHGAQNFCFGCGLDNPTGLQLKFALDEENQIVVSVATIPQSFEGPPTYVHGGIISTMLDEAMSKSVRMRGVTAMTRHMEIDLRRPVPSGQAVRIEGRWLRSEERKHWTEARILDQKGTVLASSTGLFVEVRARRMQRAPE
ncbi:PaaI family thioesterase [Telmatobacter bradus]|uniref:PaaI family thioesterase n=1 Tax=Telmatobacter bradus TaxID=474953 RepID=UPI003B42C747